MIFYAVWVFMLVVLVVSWRMRHLARTREAYLHDFEFPKGLFAKVIQQYPHLTPQDMDVVAQGLKQFFWAYLKSGCKLVGMPSQVADALWHEFILYTHNYQQFTQRAFGQFLHHTPAQAMGGLARSNTGLRRCWRFACLQESIDPRKPSRLPLLFALDDRFHIPDGFHYVPDCRGVRASDGGCGGGSAVHCGGDFSDASMAGGVDGLSDGGSGGDGDGGGCGGGCGGD